MSETRTMSVDVPKAFYEEIEALADFRGKSISELVLDSILDEIELWEDMEAIAEYEKEKAEGTLVTTPWEVVQKELGLA